MKDPLDIAQRLSRQVARLVSDMMTSVTEEGGTGTDAALEGYLVAGKTGTAQMADLEHGGYLEDTWVSSFVGFVPADRPRLAMADCVLPEPDSPKRPTDSPRSTKRSTLSTTTS